jgi:succinate dehydrogenase / fumarate reductase cytochrome b subunit
MSFDGQNAPLGGRGTARPLSPHLQVWRWHVTMLTSILHRATGLALYMGAALLVGWAASLAAGPVAFGRYKGRLGSPLGRLALIAFTFAAFCHLANGVRHRAWDAGRGFEPRIANVTAAAVIVFGAAATLLVWTLAAMTGTI